MGGDNSNNSNNKKEKTYKEICFTCNRYLINIQLSNTNDYACMKLVILLNAHKLVVFIQAGLQMAKQKNLK